MEGTALLGGKVIAEVLNVFTTLIWLEWGSFEFTGGDTRKTLGLTGDESISIFGLDEIQPLQEVRCEIGYPDGSSKDITIKCRIDTAIEIEYIEHGGVLHYVLRNLAKAS